VLFCADAVFGTDVLIKYGLPYATDVEAQMESINRLQNTEFKHYLPATPGRPTSAPLPSPHSPTHSNIDLMSASVYHSTVGVWFDRRALR
jgi:hypothetical protein